MAFASVAPIDMERPCTTTSGPVGFALPNSSETRRPLCGAWPKRSPCCSIRDTTACQTDGASRTLMKPATASMLLKLRLSSGAWRARSATRSAATSCGERCALLASEKATFVAKSPNSGRRGASNASNGAGTAYFAATISAAASAKARNASSSGRASSVARDFIKHELRRAMELRPAHSSKGHAIRSCRRARAS